MSHDSHSFENFHRDDDVKVGSERSFGFVFTVLFLIIGLWPLFHDGVIRFWAIGIAGGFALVSLATPALLKPLNVIWFKFGLLLHKIVNPIVMGLMFFLVMTPIALLMKILGKVTFYRHFDADAQTYWIERAPPGPEPQSMKNQF
ncbi:SxtJ family membrane protein [Magnetovibrio sp.]|uniref:SxtJ family membrane protein n=1 Tax=Magnetovibrio sp. TaxID=2024836 RepID=UPI002F92812E